MKLAKHKNVLFVKFLMEDGKQWRFALGLMWSRAQQVTQIEWTGKDRKMEG